MNCAIAIVAVAALNLLVLFLAKPRYPAARVKPDTEDEAYGDMPNVEVR